MAVEASIQLGEILGEQTRELRSTRETQGLEPGTIPSFFVFGNYRFRIRIINVLIESQTIGTAFILGHPNNAVLGTDALGTGTQGSFTTVESVVLNQTIPVTAREEIADWLASVAAVVPTHIAFGTGTTAYQEDDTTLGTEIDRGTIDTYNVATSKTVKYQIEIKSTDTGFHGTAFREVGVFNDGTTGDMFARVIISSITMDNTKNYRVTFTLVLGDDTFGNAVMTDAGLNEIREWMGNDSATAPTHTAWGTGTTSPIITDTTLEGETNRNALDSQSRLDQTAVFETILTTAQGNGNAITKSGIFNAGAAGDLFAETEFGAINKTSLFQIFETDRITVL